ncbi:hypothetical protein PHLCEN_2v13615 [Hermanssonia centrifuga]|uniref:AN1-type domain-containing protein n=1 Tax=Hermanssonia centrifuga TaxID=98765 RepID=A0A2R6NDM9_9APHY|nr:hypothetical protein PHLCEN_2v13615 [Hermanssonia centrifuga]
MSGTSTPTPERDEQLLDIGHQCSAPTCHLVDFLPFKCQHCNQSFCDEHFLPASHKCDKYDETKHNRIAPSCPLCNTPVAIPPGQDPNVRMERHINTECSVVTGRTKASITPHCAKAKCGKVLFSPIRCDTCKKQFCPQHRFPKDHTCAAALTSSAANSAKPMKSLPAQASAASFAAIAAMKRAAKDSTVSSNRPGLQTPNKVTVPPTKPISASLPAKPNLFSKTDRRARAERESRRKAMQARAKKGLLSEEEKAILAAEEAEAATEKDGCVIA